MKQVGSVTCDFSRFATDDFEMRTNPQTGLGYHIAYMRCRMQLSLESLEVEVVVNRSRVGYAKFTIAEEEPREEPAEYWSS